jgi:hypothetical protein
VVNYKLEFELLILLALLMKMTSPFSMLCQAAMFYMQIAICAENFIPAVLWIS